MTKGRTEAFSDGVLAILITIMVLELKVPRGSDWSALRPLVPVFLSYLLSFLFLGIYWNNHHHLFQAVKRVNGTVLWANIHLLFWLSLIPFGTAWMGANNFSTIPVALYGFLLFMSGTSYYLLTRALLSSHENRPTLTRALGEDFKGKVSVMIYGIAIALAFHNPILACGCYVIVALLWLIPDRRIEKVLLENAGSNRGMHEHSTEEAPRSPS